MKATRGLIKLSQTPTKRVVMQDYARDEFGELPTLKHVAAEAARALGHQMGPWHQRKNDPYGRWDAWCVTCNRVATVAVEPPPALTLTYGKALTEECAS